MSRKVAIFQSTFGACGRTAAMLYFIEELNSMGIVPDVYSYVFHDKVVDLFGKKIEFNKRRIAMRLPRGFGVLKIAFLNLAIRRVSARYDLLLNSNNTTIFIPSTARTLTYIHFPIRKGRQDEGFEKGLAKRILRKTMAAMMKLESLEVSDKHTVLCNSAYTKEATIEVFSVQDLADDVRVLHPAVNIDEFRCDARQRDNSVVSLARFEETKRQQEQILIARELPDLTFHIAGAAQDDWYYEDCVRLVKEQNIENVKLHKDLPFDELRSIMARAKFFLHTTRWEPFGIAIVESIAAGCIPVVHDSGGPREIVPLDMLRFKSKDDAVGIFRRLSGTSLEPLRTQLQEHARQYDKNVFRKRVKEILAECLT